MNLVILVGNLTGPPELRYTASGTAVCNMRMAVNRRYRTPAGEKKEEVLFIDVVAWGKQGEACAEYLEKGSKILARGELVSREWTDRGGQRRYAISVNTHVVEFLSRKHSEGARPAPPSEHGEPVEEDVPF